MRKTPLAKIGRKRKARGPTEKRTFFSIWRDRPHYCGVCKGRVREPKTRCFAHVLNKGVFPEYRCNPNNIILVCSTHCHEMVDMVKVGKRQAIIDRLAEGKEVTYNFLTSTY